VDRQALTGAINEGSLKLGQTLPSGADDRLAALLEELSRWSRRMNLTALRDPDAMVSGHVLDSLSVRPHLSGANIIDIGTGAGFPGLPLAITEPDLCFTLLDGNARKIGFVQHISQRLGLANVAAVRARAEDYAPARRFDTVLARAVSSTRELVELSAHLLQPNGVLLAMKGREPAQELDDVPDDWTYGVTELSVPGLEEHARHVIRLTKEPST